MKNFRIFHPMCFSPTLLMYLSIYVALCSSSLEISSARSHMETPTNENDVNSWTHTYTMCILNIWVCITQSTPFEAIIHCSKILPNILTCTCRQSPFRYAYEAGNQTDSLTRINWLSTNNIMNGAHDVFIGIDWFEEHNPLSYYLHARHASKHLNGLS